MAQDSPLPFVEPASATAPSSGDPGTLPASLDIRRVVGAEPVDDLSGK